MLVKDHPSSARLDAAATALLDHDVALVHNDELRRPTPCAGWNVEQLIRHMNEQHAAITGVATPTADGVHDQRELFAVGCAQWTLALHSAVGRLRVPGSDEPVAWDQVRAVHFVDMLVHRWDLGRAVGRPTWPDPDPDLLAAALLIAARVNAPGSPLFGRAYASPLQAASTASTLDRLVSLLGRDPAWCAPALDDRW